MNKRELLITSKKSSRKQRDEKLSLIEKKSSQKEEASLEDFLMKCEFNYKYKYSKGLFFEEEIFELGKSNNFLFYNTNSQIIQYINFDISEITDSRGNTILHYAILKHDLDLIKAIIDKAKADSVIHKLINSRNVDGTNSLGMAFLFVKEKNLAGLEIVSIFANIPEYQINSHLNNKQYMDYSTAKLIGGTTLLHNVLLEAAKCKKEDKQFISKIFKVLNYRVCSEEINSDLYLNPNYPTMHPGRLIVDLDGHMISTNHLLEKLEFKSKKIEQLCKKYFYSILQTYEANQFDDSSGDSQEDTSHAHTYKAMLLELNDFIKHSLDERLTFEESKDNFQRTLDKFELEHVMIPDKVCKLIFPDGKYDEQQLEKLWISINSIEKEAPKIIDQTHKTFVNSIVVPLFHGVPFMHSQYTNYQRREVVKKIFAINRKLLGKFDDSMKKEEYTLTPAEQTIIGIHSRTSTASEGMQSLYEVITADEDHLQRLDEADQTLLEYFTCQNLPESFKNAMKEYIFNFSKSPIEKFWTNCNSHNVGTHSLTMLPDDSIIKYRFPVIATSKAPDHAVRFAIGRNVEGATRGETAMQPDYTEDGHPTHRVAGLVYVTLHNLTDLIGRCNNHTVIDINEAISSGKIKKGQSASRIMNQMECDFLGKIDSDSIIAVIPIIYPSMKVGESFDITYHQEIFGLNPKSKDNSVVSPTKIRKDTDSSPNPDIMSSSGNISGFGKMIVPTIVSLVNGLVTSVASKQEKFLCSIKENGELIPYELDFDQEGQQFSKAQQNLKTENVTHTNNGKALWWYIAQQLLLQTDQINSETSDDGMGDIISLTGNLSLDN